MIKQFTYAYDTASNRTSETVATSTTSSTPNNVNEITSQSGGTVRTLTYDLNGSLTNGGKTSASATNASKVYTCEWDGGNRLVALTYTGTTNRSEFSYDGLSRVVKIVEKSGTTVKSTRKIVWCGNQMCEFRDATDAVTGRVYAQGEFIGNTGYTFMRDHLGSIRELIKTDGKTLGVRLDYDPYGRQTNITGSAVSDFSFTGLYRHAASGLNFATYRAYDPDLGRWISRDPIGEAGGINLYGYVTNSPINSIDALGLIDLNLLLQQTDLLRGFKTFQTLRTCIQWVSMAPTAAFQHLVILHKTPARGCLQKIWREKYGGIRTFRAILRFSYIRATPVMQTGNHEISEHSETHQLKGHLRKN